MEGADYLAIRKAVNIERQQQEHNERITFEELSILAMLELRGQFVKTSEIAQWQDCLRPTMTHRTNHLFKLGLIERFEGSDDKRNILCAISEKGKGFIKTMAEGICSDLKRSGRLSRVNPERIVRYLEAMGTTFVSAADLVVLALDGLKGPTTISDIVLRVGLLQPTVSMSVKSLEDAALVKRGYANDIAAKPLAVELTQSGNRLASSLVAAVKEIVISRRSRL